MKTLGVLDTATDNFKFHILSSKIYAITLDDVSVFCRGIVSVSVSYRSHNFGTVTTLIGDLRRDEGG